MKFNLQPYELELTYTPKKRRGILIELQGYFGDVAPLEGWSRETYEQAFEQLEQVLIHNKHDTELYPSVAFGLESVLYQVNTQKKSFSVPLSALLMGTREEILEKAAVIEKQGYKSAKLKIAQLSLADAKNVVDQLKNTFSLRIDLNKAWDLTCALEFFSYFKPCDFDYIEEPLKNTSELKNFPYPIALDESGYIDNVPTLKALVFKPTLLGGLTILKKTHALTKKKKLQLVLSSAFESGIGIYNIAHMANALGLTHPLGLDTYRFLKQDLLKTPLDFSKGFLEI